MKHPFIYILTFAVLLILLFGSCKRKSRAEVKNVPQKEMNVYVQEIIQDLLEETDKKTGKADDSTKLYTLPVLDIYYASNEYSPVWSSTGKWKIAADSLLNYLGQCETDGLFKDDYQYALLHSVKQTLDYDSIKMKDAFLWARADLLLTDAFMHILQDLKQGRLQDDSLAWKYIPEKQEQFFKTGMDKLRAGTSISSIIQSMQPTLEKYQALKKTIPGFLDSMDRKNYTYLAYPYKDSITFVKKLLQRFSESGLSEVDATMPDSVQLQQLIKNYQSEKQLKPTGKISAAMISLLNNTDEVKFKRIAVTLDRYKQMPAQLPEKYVWVNLPSYYLQVWDTDTVAFESKTIIGKPATPTPDISSEISNLVIYPTWTVPNSIIVKEILPALKKNPGYLEKKGLALYNNKGDMVDPYSVDWTKYNKGIPYYVRQNSGDDNALGVIKFNFKNPYDVYLHDTNQRYLFKNKSRSLSHGCVRVQDWQKLAFYIIRNDSINAAQPQLFKTNTDSIMRWISQKQLHRVDIKQRLPVFIRYFSCEAINGSIKFYEDVYNEDKAMIEKYFALK